LLIILLLIRGVEPSCSAADIKKAYRKAALRHHPDKVLIAFDDFILILQYRAFLLTLL
jgi:curved DNA-binding protein CbpA